MKLARPALVLVAISVVASSFSASAAPSTKPLTVVVTDQKGDANALNDQGFGALPEGTATPGSQDALDIVKATIADTGKTVTTGKGRKAKTKWTCTGFTITMEFAGAVNASSPVIYRLIGHTTNNDSIFQLYFNNAPQNGGTQVRYGAGSADDTTDLATPAKIVGNKVVLTITPADISTFGEKAGNSIMDMSFETSISSGNSFVPQVDQALTDSPFKIC